MGRKYKANKGNVLRVQAGVLLDRDKYMVHSGTRCCDHRAEEIREGGKNEGESTTTCGGRRRSG